VLVADTATTFASSVIRLLTDKQIWGRLAKTGWEFMQTRHGSDVVFERFSRVLAQILNPASIQPIFVEEMEPGGSSRFDYELDTMVREKVLREGRVKGFCNVWGRSTEFVVSSDNLRESIVSTVSSSINRHRQLICALSMAIFGHPQASLPALAEHINQSKWKVYIAEGNSVLSNFLMRNLNRNLFVCSEYFGPAYQSGEGVNGVLHEDLLHTSFPDEAFNLIITSEVLEHVSDAPTAERELARILKPGGIYCFTVPFAPAHEHDLVYAEVDEFGNTRHLSEPQFHEDPLRPGGALVYRVFTFHDLKQRFESMECEFKSYRFWSESVGILGSDCWAHTVKKRSVAAANMAQGAASP
jgi:SAM-dependent methyltransferase